MADIITQAELASVLHDYNALGQRILVFRRRLVAGAFVEPGELNAQDPETCKLDMGPTECTSMYGLDIAPVGKRNELYQVEPPERQAEPESNGPELPEWLEETPEYTYQMDAWNSNTTVQEIELTRDEYIALKQHLAKMRGISVPEEAHAN